MPQLEIERMTFGPYAIGRLDGKTVMVPHAVPGDIVDVELAASRSHYSIAELRAVVRPGSGRRVPPCPFLPRCGGCDWQQLSYQAQLQAKAELLKNEMSATLGVPLDGSKLIEAAPAEFGYRVRIRLQVAKDGRVGFHELHSRRLVEIDHCMVAEQSLSLVYARQLATRLAPHCRELELVSQGPRQVMVAFLARAPDKRELAAARELLEASDPVAGIIMRGAGQRRVLGDATISFELEPGCQLEVEADSFSQVNQAQNRAAVRLVMEFAQPSASARLLDLFCGAGNFSLPAARRGAEVLGVDAQPLAVEAARRNALRLGFHSARFIAMQAADTARFLDRASYRPHVAILDPPRAGAPELIPLIARLRPAVLIYVSCDLATLRRDLQLAERSGYKLDRITALDFFPNTHHIELVARSVLT